MKRTLLTIVASAILVLSTNAQTADVRLNFDERFFDALLEAVFTKLEAPKVPLAFTPYQSSDVFAAEWADTEYRFVRPGFGPSDAGSSCDESVALKREVDGVRTAVRFRQGKIYAPIAFLGNYNPPLVGCIEFQGWAETKIEVAFDRAKNALVGNAKVLNVNLSGTNGLGGGLIARMVQSSIDRKINPIEIVNLEKLSFTFPVRQSGALKMTARNVRTRVNDGSLDVIVTYEFQKAE